MKSSLDILNDIEKRIPRVADPELSSLSRVLTIESLSRRLPAIIYAKKPDKHAKLKKVHNEIRDQAENIYKTAISHVISIAKAEMLHNLRSYKPQGDVLTSSVRQMVAKLPPTRYNGTEEVVLGGAPFGNQNARKGHVTETPEFKEWFGESKVVGGDGKPLRVYHGTTQDVSAFEIQPEGGSRGVGSNGGMIWFTDNPVLAGQYASDSGADSYEEANKNANIIPAYLKLEKPFRVTGTGAQSPASDSKYDGIIITDKNGKSVYGVKSPTQVKSAIGNSGKFDPKDKRINASDHFIHASLPDSLMFDLDAFSKSFLSAMRSAGQAAFSVTSRGLSSELGIGERETPEGIVREFLNTRENKISGCPDIIYNQIKESLKEGIDNGETMDELSQRVQDEFDDCDDTRGALIAATESQSCYGTSMMDSLEAGGFSQKGWQTSDDELVRESHMECEEAGAIDADEDFPNGLAYPGDPDGDADEVINCRCYLIPGDQDEGLTDEDIAEINAREQLVNRVEKILAKEEVPA